MLVRFCALRFGAVLVDVCAGDVDFIPGVVEPRLSAGVNNTVGVVDCLTVVLVVSVVDVLGKTVVLIIGSSVDVFGDSVVTVFGVLDSFESELDFPIIGILFGETTDVCVVLALPIKLMSS